MSEHAQQTVETEREDFELILSSRDCEEVNIFANGPILAVLYKMALECEDMDKFNSHLSPHDTWERWIRIAIFPLLLQSYLLDIFQENFSTEGDNGLFEKPDLPAALYVMAAIAVFLYESAIWTVGPSLRCMYCVCQMNYSRHPQPKTTKFVAWLLYLTDLFIGFRVIGVGTFFIQYAGSATEVFIIK